MFGPPSVPHVPLIKSLLDAKIGNVPLVVTYEVSERPTCGPQFSFAYNGQKYSYFFYSLLGQYSSFEVLMDRVIQYYPNIGEGRIDRHSTTEMIKMAIENLILDLLTTVGIIISHYPGDYIEYANWFLKQNQNGWYGTWVTKEACVFLTESNFDIEPRVWKTVGLWETREGTSYELDKEAYMENVRVMPAGWLGKQ